MKDFERITYLQEGNERQRAAFRVLAEHKVMEALKPFVPLLAGTIPIGIDTAESDLDIICCWSDKSSFCAVLNQHFSECQAYHIKEKEVKGRESVVARFYLGGFEVEVFGQSRPSREQEAFRHMLVEYRLLQHHGEAFRQQVLALKRQGMKTEPAFAKLLQLQGDPYEALLSLQA
ncbi:MAG: DUF4269 domain-containing protein [Hymenobacteraceae bacterium]|nr:DUF4269 domain-containing protein [Hymenobacteraceae bacterium]MDX5481937.1 DUF4269 domain-containing protein [Hymenobacteraceae bacterium]